MLFYVIGEHFQESAVRKSRKSIKDLIDNRPDIVTVVREEDRAHVAPLVAPELYQDPSRGAVADAHEVDQPLGAANRLRSRVKTRRVTTVAGDVACSIAEKTMS